MGEESPEPIAPVASPPLGFAGGLVPWTLVLGRSPNVYAVLQDFEAFSSGVRCVLRARFRPGVFDPLGSFPGTPGGAQIAVIFADGRTGTVGPGHSGSRSGGVVFNYFGGGGSGHEWTMHLWLSPLPPIGPLTFTIGWPEKGAPLTTVVVEAGELVDAAENAERLW
jgi:hypothetical protein